MPLETDSMFQRLGGLELPVRTADIGTTWLAALDPVRDQLLKLFESAINSELSEAWTKVATTSGKTLEATPVADTLPDEPTEKILTQRTCKVPLLALHRDGTATYEQQTLEITRLTQPWALHYILGPLDVIDARQLKDVCVAVAKIVALVIRKRGHASFESGALQFFGTADPSLGEKTCKSPLTSLRIVSHEGPGQAAFGGEASTITYWASEMKLESTEISGYDEEAEVPLDAADITVNVGDGEGTLPAMIVAKTDQDPNG